MGIIGKVVKLGLDVSGLPIDLAKDVFTIGGTATDRKQPYTTEKLKSMSKTIKAIKEQLEK